MQQNQYLVTAPFAGFPDDIQAQIAHAVFELSESVLKQDLFEFSLSLGRYYDLVFDYRWIDEFARRWRDEMEDVRGYLYNTMWYDCLRYIEHVRKYKADFTVVPAFDKTSSKVMNMKTQRAAAIKNLERLKNVLNEIFEDRQERQIPKYERDMKKYHPDEDFQALYASEKHVGHIAELNQFKQDLIDNIDESIAEFRQSLQ